MATDGHNALVDFLSATDSIDQAAHSIDFADLTIASAGVNALIGVDSIGNAMVN